MSLNKPSVLPQSNYRTAEVAGAPGPLECELNEAQSSYMSVSAWRSPVVVPLPAEGFPKKMMTRILPSLVPCPWSQQKKTSLLAMLRFLLYLPAFLPAAATGAGSWPLVHVSVDCMCTGQPHPHCLPALKLQVRAGRCTHHCTGQVSQSRIFRLTDPSLTKEAAGAESAGSARQKTAQIATSYFSPSRPRKTPFLGHQLIKPGAFLLDRIWLISLQAA